MKPILFNTEMVRAILAGRKTVTRRVVKPHNQVKAGRMGYRQGEGLWIDGYGTEAEPSGHIKDYSVSSCWMRKDLYIQKYAPYQPGDILYVRETWAEMPYGIVYRADGEKPEGWDNQDRWHSSLHMPKEAARTFLRVTSVRVERLQEITEAQVEAEGVQAKHERSCDGTSARIAFAELWDSTLPPNKNKFKCPENGWGTNPWVWAIEFERCEKPGEESE